MSRHPRRDDADEATTGNFLSRWSQRKLAQGDDDASTGLAGNENAAGEGAVANAGATAGQEEAVLTDADMPDVESIDGDSVVADFFSPGVSEALRRKALKKLFFSGAFAARDGLDDYDLDYTSFEGLGAVVTADMRHRIEKETEKLRQSALAAEDEQGTAAEDATTDAGIGEDGATEIREECEEREEGEEAVTVGGTKDPLAVGGGTAGENA